MDKDRILDLVNQNNFMNHCGIKARLRDDGSFETFITMDEMHRNPYGFLHGGIMYSMADVAAGMNARIHMKHPVTMSSDFHFFSNTVEGDICATVKAAHTGKNITVLRATVKCGEKVLAKGDFTFFNNARISYTDEDEIE